MPVLELAFSPWTVCSCDSPLGTELGPNSFYTLLNSHSIGKVWQSFHRETEGYLLRRTITEKLTLLNHLGLLCIWMVKMTSDAKSMSKCLHTVASQWRESVQIYSSLIHLRGGGVGSLVKKILYSNLLKKLDPIFITLVWAFRLTSMTQSFLYAAKQTKPIWHLYQPDQGVRYSSEKYTKPLKKKRH